MSLFDGILLISDIDGTLINKNFEIPQRNIDAINYFVENGGNFSLATGRSLEATRPYSTKVNMSCPAIVFNGGALCDFHKNEIVAEDFLPEHAKGSILKILEAFPNIGAEVHSGSDLYVIRWSEKGRKHVSNENLNYTETTLDKVMNIKWHKVLYAASPEELAPVKEFVKTIPCEGTHYISTSEVYFEYFPEQVNKGRALLKLADYLNISHDNTYAIGDFYNDIEMIKAAKVGAYVNGAPEELKATANYVACNAEDGAVGDFIEYITKIMEEKR